MYFRILNDEVSGEITYLLADLDAQEAVLVDPHARDLPVLMALLAERSLRLRWVLRTHQHDALQPQEPVVLARLAAPLVQGEPAAGARAVADGDVLAFGDECVHVLHTPGHTPHCLSFLWRDRLFCGGLLAVTACPLQAGPVSAKLLWDSVNERVFKLPDETLVFSGHELRARAVSTVLEQRRWHPMFASLTRDEFLAHMASLPEKQDTAQTL
jgi:glyoxylase-like metal-dependent hydrolase (beta-lactamase superfamily II)